MKINKKIVSLLIISMLLSSCQDKGDISESVAITSESTLEITTTDEADISESSTSQTEETSDLVDESEDEHQPVAYSDSLPSVVITTEKKTEGFFFESSVDIQGDAYADLNKAFDEVEQLNYESYDKKHDSSFGRNQYFLCRCDSNYTSILYESAVDLKTYDFQGYTYMNDGNKVEFSDLIKNEDMPSFIDAANEYIQNKYSKQDDIDLAAVNSQLEKGISTDWYLDVNGIMLIFENVGFEESSPLILFAHLPYSEFDAYISDEFLPGDKSMIGTYTDDDLFYGTHTIKSSLSSSSYTKMGPGRDFTNLAVDDNAYEFDSSVIEWGGYATYVKNSDGKSYLVIEQGYAYELVEGAEYFKIFDITDGSLDLIYSSDEIREVMGYSNIEDVENAVAKGE